MNSQIDDSQWEAEALRQCPDALIGGHQVLMETGVSTQITRLRFVLLPEDCTSFSMPGCEAHRRPRAWLDTVRGAGGIEHPLPGLLPRLRAGAALADLARYSERAVDSDEVDFEFIDSDELHLFRLLTASS